MLGRAVTFALVGLEPRRVEVEAHLRSSTLPSFSIVGLADRACQEAKHRVRSGVDSALLEWPNRAITVNLAPAALRKEGTGFDLAIALTVLAASAQVPRDRLEEHACIGELGLDGRIRPVAGTIAAAEGAARAGLARVLCPVDSSQEAALAGVEAVGVRHLAEAVGYLLGHDAIAPAEPPERAPRRDGAARPRRRPRTGAWSPGARDRGGRIAQPVARRAAGHGEDDARSPAAVHPAAALARGGARGHADPFRRGDARRPARGSSTRRRSARRTTAPRPRRSSAADRCRGPAR